MLSSPLPFECRYGFTIAEYLAGLGKVSLHLEMMSQPPWDDKLAKYYLLHYTYGQDFDPRVRTVCCSLVRPANPWCRLRNPAILSLQGVFTPGKVGAWHFDKRDYMGKPIPRNLQPPPKGCKNELTIRLIQSFNEATDAIPCWDEYVTSRIVHIKDDGGTCKPVAVDRNKQDTWANFPENQ